MANLMKQERNEVMKKTRRGNFHDVLNSFGMLDLTFRNHWKYGSKNTKMILWMIQNNVIECLATFFSTAGRTRRWPVKPRITLVFRLNFKAMMTLKFSPNAKVTHALTYRRPVRPAADYDFESYDLIQKFFYCVCVILLSITRNQKYVKHFSIHYTFKEGQVN